MQLEIGQKLISVYYLLKKLRFKRCLHYDTCTTYVYATTYMYHNVNFIAHVRRTCTPYTI